MTYQIPTKVLTQHTALLGKTGSGKTSTGKIMVEQIVRADPGARVCILDAVKSDWWGLTSSADGKRPGLPFVILGGPRGHVALNDSAGKPIGELVANGSLPLSIIDMADFGAGGLQKFFNEFAPALMRHMRGVLYLVLEEAHEFAPKERAGIGAETMAIHWAKKLATAGRSKGIRLIVLTQRTQALHNALLGSCDTMIAHRLTAPADQEPVKKWLKANVDKATFEKVSGSLASLKTGSGWICSGEAQVTELVQFPKITTYDNSATPTSQSGEHSVSTAPVDRDKLRAIIGDAVKTAEADDPKLLRAEIARLKATAPAAKEDVGSIAAAEDRGFARGYRKGLLELVSSFEAFGEKLASISEAVNQAISDTNAQRGTVDLNLNLSSAAPVPAPVQRREQAAPPPRPSPASGGDIALTNAMQRAINAIGWWKKIGYEPIERERAAVVCGLSPKASTFGVYISKLSALGLVEAPRPGFVALTAAGWALAVVPDAVDAEGLREVARSLLGNQETRVFDIVYAAYPKSISRLAVAEKMGLSPTASTTGVYISKVNAYGLLDVSTPGQVRAAGWLFP